MYQDQQVAAELHYCARDHCTNPAVLLLQAGDAAGVDAAAFVSAPVATAGAAVADGTPPLGRIDCIQRLPVVTVAEVGGHVGDSS